MSCSKQEDGGEDSVGSPTGVGVSRFRLRGIGRSQLGMLGGLYGGARAGTVPLQMEGPGS